MKALLALLTLTLMIGCSTRDPKPVSSSPEYPMVQPLSTVTHTNINPIVQQQ